MAEWTGADPVAVVSSPQSQVWPWAPTTIERGTVDAVQSGRRQLYELTLTYA